MTTKELLALVALLDARFVSGNSVPVERAHIKADEWKLLRSSLAPIATALCAEVEALRKDAERWRAYERELPDSADSTRAFLHGVAVLKAAKLAAKEPK